MELGIPVVMAVNMVDIMEKTGDKIHIDKLSKKLGCEVVEISALKGTGIQRSCRTKQLQLARKKDATARVHEFNPKVAEDVIQTVEEKLIDEYAGRAEKISSRSSFLRKMTRSKSR